MLPKLFTHKPKRLFTFGCSFTKYYLGTYANILGHELDCEFYNFGQSGGGNQYIFNAINQADRLYNFNSDDLVIVEWTNATRDDLFKNNSWVCRGNVYSQDDYDTNRVDVNHYSIRDFATINSTYNMLENKCQFHFLSMVNLETTFNQFEKLSFKTDKVFKKLKKIYNLLFKHIQPSFYEVLWNNKIPNKRKWNEEHFGCYFWDLHPTPSEHLKYLQSTFDYQFNEQTISAVNDAEQRLVRIINNLAKENNLLLGDVNFVETQLDDNTSAKIKEHNLRKSDYIDYTKFVL